MLDKCFRTLIVIFALLLAAIMVVEVILRYGLETPFLGIEEASVLVALWIYFLCGAYVTMKRTHLHGGVMELLISRESTRRKIRLMSTVLCFIVVCTFLVFSIDYLVFLSLYGRQSSYLQWPTLLWALSMAFGFFFMVIFLALQCIHDWKKAW